MRSKQIDYDIFRYFRTAVLWCVPLKYMYIGEKSCIRHVFSAPYTEYVKCQRGNYGKYTQINSHLLTPQEILTRTLPIATIVPYYANSFGLDETPSNSASHPDQTFLTLEQHFH